MTVAASRNGRVERSPADVDRVIRTGTGASAKLRSWITSATAFASTHGLLSANASVSALKQSVLILRGTPLEAAATARTAAGENGFFAAPAVSSRWAYIGFNLTAVQRLQPRHNADPLQDLLAFGRSQKLPANAG